MAASERVGGVDIAVACDAESGGVGLARDMGRSLLADLAHPHPRVARGELVGRMDLGVTGHAQKGGVGTAEESGRGRFTGVAELGRHPPTFHFNNNHVSTRVLPVFSAVSLK